MFAKEVIGIITKIDLAKNSNDIIKCEKILESAGVSRVFKVDTLSGTGIEELKKYILGE